MRIGTRSVLFGAHQFLIHPVFVAIAWTRLYGFPWKIQLWAAFFCHDFGYLGKPNMDGPEGETHPILGARIMARLFGDTWGEFTVLHSRYFARRLHKRYSQLCVADKYAIVCTPWFIYLPMVWASGELAEYMGGEKYRDRPYPKTPRAWWRAVQRDMRKWVMIHREVDRDNQWPNGFDPKDVPVNKLPGYLEGGYEPARYKVTKADGTINPDAKYLVVRYDKDRDPHGVIASLAYAASVFPENSELALGIIMAVQAESGLDLAGFNARYGTTLNTLMAAFRNADPKTPEGIAFALEMDLFANDAK